MPIPTLRNTYADHLRPFVRQLMVSTLPGPMKSKNHYAIVGLPRSGTSWLAKAISLANSTTYYFEPDQAYQGKPRYPYIRPDRFDKELHKHIDDTFKGRIHSEYIIAEQGITDIFHTPFNENILVKWIRFPLCLEWIQQHFPTLRIVQIIRHPAPLFLSWKIRNWDPGYSLEGLIKQPELIDGPLHPYKRTILNANTFWTKAGALWASTVFMQLKAHQDHWIFKEHEWYCENPEKRVKWLVSELGLSWNDQVTAFLSPQRKRDTGPGYGTRRNSISEIKKWHDKIQTHELQEMKAIIQEFDLPFVNSLDLARHWFD